MGLLHTNAAFLFVLGSWAGCRAPLDGVPAQPVVLTDDGGWCWFQDERALALGDRIVFGSVAGGREDTGRRGSIEVTSWHPASGEVERVTLHERLEFDDHNAPALLQLEDESLLAVYAKHGTDHLVRWRHLARVEDFENWSPEASLTIAEGARLGVTYSNLHHGARSGEVLNFFRGLDWDPCMLVSQDAGESWSLAGRVLGGPGRPYVNYTSRGDGRVHLIATEQHPRDFDNSLYHGIVRGVDVLSSTGEVLGEVGSAPPAPDELTCIFRGSASAVAWPVDLEMDGDGQPVAIFSVQLDGESQARGKGGLDHRLHYARFDGSTWHTEEVGRLGQRLYAGEDDYTGLAAIDPGDPGVVYLSTDVDPASGVALISSADGKRHRELFRAVRDGNTGTWSFTAVTRNSTRDNLRPIVPRGAPHALLWLRGELTTYGDYALEVVGLPLPEARQSAARLAWGASPITAGANSELPNLIVPGVCPCPMPSARPGIDSVPVVALGNFNLVGVFLAIRAQF